MNHTIRQLSVADVQAFRAIRLEALRDSPEAFGGDYAAENLRPIETFARQLEENAIYGAFHEDTLIGVVGLFWDDGAKTRHHGNFYTVYVTPSARGTGCALPMIQAGLDHARMLGKIQVLLGVSTHNAAAIALYRKAGFEIYGTEPRSLCVNGRYIDEHLMVRFLDEAPGKTNHD